MKSLLRLAIVSLLVPAALTAQTVIRLNGSDTLARKLQPFAAEIGQAHGVELKFLPNGVGNGVADLASGQAEVAMIVGSVDYFARLLNEAKPGSVDTTTFRLFRLPEKHAAPATLVVHPGVPVEKLTRDQIREIFSGQITNWSKIGGPELPVVPVLQQPMDGYFATLAVIFVHGTPSSPNVKRVTKSSELCAVVAATPGAIAFLSNGVAATGTGVRLIPLEPQVIPPSALATVGEPTGPLKAVIDELVANAK